VVWGNYFYSNLWLLINWNVLLRYCVIHFIIILIVNEVKVRIDIFQYPGVNYINIYACIFCTKFWRQSQNITRKAAKKDVLYEKFIRLTLMKLTSASVTESRNDDLQVHIQLIRCPKPEFKFSRPGIRVGQFFVSQALILS